MIRALSHKKYFQKEHHRARPDYVLLAVIGLIVFFGLLFLSSASSVFSFKKFGNANSLLLKQIFLGVIPGIVLFFIFSKIDYRKYQRFTYLFFGATVFLLILPLIPGIRAEYGTSRSWINLFGFSFQPAEFAKLTFLIFLSGCFHKKGYFSIRQWYYGFFPFVGYLGVVSFLLFLQPDFGMLMVLAFAAVTVYFVAGAKVHHLVLLFTVGVFALVAIIFKKPYIENRFRVFLNPETDIQNVGYQLYQSLLAIGSGGWFGRGFGKSTQKFSYLPEVYSDSIFSIIAEEMGFLVICSFIILYLIVLYRGIRISQKAPDPFGRFLATGITAWVIFQTFLNIGVMTGLAPLTGVTLPFVSAGGTSLVALLAAMGILMNISRLREE